MSANPAKSDNLMTAIVYTKYGPPDVLQSKDIPKPVTKANEVLIKIIATSVTKGDVLSRSLDVPGMYKLPLRLMLGIFRPRRKVLGHEFSGEVEAVGSKVTKFKPGDQVFGSTGMSSGTYAEYICLPETGVIALKPANMSHEEAATVPVGGITALNILKKANIKDGEKLLVHGASGSVGLNTVQIAKFYGAEVTGVCSTGNMEMVRSLGADKVIDYTKEDFTKNGETYDVILDAVNKISKSKCKRSLNKGGRYLSAKTMAAETAESLDVLRQLIEEKTLKTVIDRTYPLNEMVEAHRYVDLGHKKGNVAVKIQKSLMKAMVYTKYGTVDELRLEKVSKPFPGKGQVLVKVMAASVNSWDWDRLTGKPRLYRLLSGISRPKLPILGADVAGVVEAVGEGVEKWKVGDAVYGDLCESGWGGFAEYVSVPANILTAKPKKMSFEEAAAIPQAGVMALQGIQDERKLNKGDHVLMNGAGGGIGTFVIQLAKLYKAKVTAVDSAEKLEFMKSLGADQVMDYRKEDFTKSDQKYDLIIDVVASRSVSDYKRALAENGVYLMIGGKVNTIVRAALLGRRSSGKGNKKIKILGHKPNKNLEEFNKLYEEGKVKPVIDKVLPLEKVPEALQYIGDAKVKGKVVIRIGS